MKPIYTPLPVAKPARIASVTEVWEQDEDCCGRVNETGQDITLETADGGGGSYIVVKTERWALEDAKDIDALGAKMKALLRRVNK